MTFDLTPDQEQLPKNRLNAFKGKKKVKNPSGENRGGSLSRMERITDVM